MSLTARAAQSDSLPDLHVYNVEQVEALPWRLVPGCPGVAQKVLWCLGDFTQTLVRYAPGSGTPGAPHLAAHLHVWVHSGEVTFAGTRLTAGSSAHVPPGVPHAATDVGAAGCVLVQMRHPHPSRGAQLLLAAQPSSN